MAISVTDPHMDQLVTTLAPIMHDPERAATISPAAHHAWGGLIAIRDLIDDLSEPERWTVDNAAWLIVGVALTHLTGITPTADTIITTLTGE